LKGHSFRATAPAAEGPWTADPEPVLDLGTPGAWDSYTVGWPSVVKVDETCYLYYTGIADFDGLDKVQVGLAISEDGINWTKNDDPETTEAPYDESDPIMGRSSDTRDKYGVENPRVVYDGERWVMLYRSRGSVPGLGLAVSEDGVRFEKLHEGPVFQAVDVPGGTSYWDYNLAEAEGIYYLYVEVGTGNNNTNIYLLTADNLE
jgi:predicted GH43/DUF377 family glycosyl hydrolase